MIKIHNPYPPFQISTPTTSILAIFLLLYILIKWKKSLKNTTKINPPTPSNSWPIIGHLHLLSGLPHIALGNLADKYGPIFMIKLGINRAVVISTAQAARECFGGTHDKVFLNRPKNIYVDLLAYDSAMFAFTPYGEYWREMRKITSIELLSNHRIDLLKDVRVSEVRSSMKILSELVADGSALVDMTQWFNDISMNTIVRLISGKSLKEFYQGEKYNQCAKALRDFAELAGVFVPADAFPGLRWLDIGGYEKRMKIVAKQIDEMAEEWLKEHEERRKSGESQEKKDFMDVLLDRFAQEKPCKFDADTVIKANCMSTILAATDTSAVTLTWALSLLLNNKDALRKTQLELDSVVGKERQVDESDLKRLTYLQAVLKETLRLYPASPLSLPRESITECTICDYHIPAGTQLFVNLYKIQRDPKVWEDPTKFQPERFLTTHKNYDFRGQNYEFMPFGSGRRICPGISFALQVMQFTLASLLHGFEITIPSNEFVDMTESLGLTNPKATPLEVIVKNRFQYHLYK